MADTGVRVDAWLWAVRVTKTRSAATALCKAGHVKIGGDNAKPAQTVRPGTEVRVVTREGTRILVVKQLLVKRVGAPLAAIAYDDQVTAIHQPLSRPPAPATCGTPAGSPRTGPPA